METLHKINRKIRKAALKSSNQFLDCFLDREEEVLQILKGFTGSKSEIYLNDLDLELDNIVRFSSLFSDITIINTSGSPIEDYHFTFFDPNHRHYLERQLTIPEEYLIETGADPRYFLPCYIFRNDSETKKLFQQYKSFLNNERLLIRPLRALYVNHPRLQQGTIFYVDPNTSNDHWYINKLNLSESILIDNGRMSISNLKDLFEISLPYLKNIDLETLSKVLEEESEILSTFRNKLSEIVKEAGNNPDRIEEIKNDIANTSVERLNKRFKQIQKSHRLTIGITVGTFILTLSTGNIDVKSIIASTGSGLGAITIANSDYQDRISDLKEDPFYLLWRIKQKS